MSINKGGSVSVAAADAGSEVNVMDVPSGKTFNMTDLHVAYEDSTGTARTVVEILDGPGGDVVDTIPLLVDSEASHEGVNRPGIQGSVVAVVESSADGPVSVTVGGEIAE